MEPKADNSRPCWFVGAAYGGYKDQSSRFIQEGIWENGSDEKYQEEVRSVQAGDRIAIKSSFTKKYELPFDNHGHYVAVMEIKAIGTVTENLGDGRTLKVDWQALPEPREWYFYTNRKTIWQVTRQDWKGAALINFAFEGDKQDISLFRNAPYWKERFGDKGNQFNWTSFYEAVADKILEYRNRRGELLAWVKKVADKYSLSYLTKKDGIHDTLQDICPFTIIGMFNRQMKDQTRKAIAKEMADFLGVNISIPDSFVGIPVLHPIKSCFFGFGSDRQDDDIDVLWEIFEQAITFADQDEPSYEMQSPFSKAYDNAAKRYGIGWNLTMGLYWIRPFTFITLDSYSRTFIEKQLHIHIGANGPKKCSNSSDYLSLLEVLKNNFLDDQYLVHSFPEISFKAWDNKSAPPEPEPELEEVDDKINETYSVSNIVDDGCFLDITKLKEMIESLSDKKNLILQGPPGTGKTWLAKRLAFALIGQRDNSRVKSIQFHPNLSYEDFIRGWRPSGDGKLTLVDGPFMEMINLAKEDPEAKYVIVIEEINRGNPAQIFGEMLTLLESDKRNVQEALELCYRREKGEKVFIPDNLYLIGTMNIADRSIAMVDLALRRRFAFVTLTPVLGLPWRNWVHSNCKIDFKFLEEIEKRINELNTEIANDKHLGAHFCVGHSYVTPSKDIGMDAKKWFQRIVCNEIGPLLEEYWFDQPKKSEHAIGKLLEGF